jgi:MerR family transcriptional regulator, light-induced transcriptional regulator
VFDFRGAVPDTGASTVLRLGDTPIVARDRLLARLDQSRNAPPASRPVRLAASAASQ